MNRLLRALERNNQETPPIWFMRQAGRYHRHYQELRRTHSFVEICKKPEVACEAALGPVRDFDFDAAILFSDLLFPLEALGIPLEYSPGPKLGWHLDSPNAIGRLKTDGAALAHELDYQYEALKLTRAALPEEKALIGFQGGAYTLFAYGVEGSHQGAMSETVKALRDGRYDGFCSHVLDLLVQNLVLQYQAGANPVAILDTAAGQLSARDFGQFVVPALEAVVARAKKQCPDVKLIYYTKGAGPAHWDQLGGFSAIGIDWTHDINAILLHARIGIQGNFSPEALRQPAEKMQRDAHTYFKRLKTLPQSVFRGWVSGLGHGVLPNTPEENVSWFVRTHREYFR